jgi:serine/threonine-protein kinase
VGQPPNAQRALDALAHAAGPRSSGPPAKPDGARTAPPTAREASVSALEALAQAVRGGPARPAAEVAPDRARPAPSAPAAVQPAPAAPPAPADAPGPPGAAPGPVKPAEPSPAVQSAAAPPAAAGPVPTPGRVSHGLRDEKADALVGTQINGFKIQGRIGSGGFGVVYRAFDTNLERSVAIKMLPPKIAKMGPAILDRFLREARSAAKLAHTNIVTIHQICPYKDTYYIVMELVDGGALHEYLAAQKRFPAGEATRIIRAAAEGLGHAHKRGIIHRDVKPGNIMMTKDGQVKVSDFGLARDVLQGHDIVGAGHSLGTPRYMAPEQARGEEPTASSDLYSLAATYYALLTGRAPFDAPTEREIMIKQVQEPVPDPRQFMPDLPIAVFRFFEKAMAKDPNDRYMTADEFVAALDRLDFSQTDAGAPTPQALAAQIGTISAEDRGSHLTEALGRAVRMAQRQRTPAPGHVVDALAAPRPGARRKSGLLLWLVVGIGAVAVIVGAIVVAIILSKTRPPEPSAGPVESVAPSTPGTTPTQPGTTPTQPSTTPTQPATTPAPPTPPSVTTSANPLEGAAQQALKDAKEYEAQAGTAPEDAIRVYEENVIKVYPRTKAAEEAQKAIERLQKGEKPPEKPPEPPAEKPPDKPAEKPTEKPPEKPPDNPAGK